MATEMSNIDDLLSSGKSLTQPETPEHDYNDNDNEVDIEGFSKPDLSDDILENSQTSEYEQNELSEKESEKEIADQDDYGNEKPKARTYTEDEVNERINKAVRERLARGNTQQQNQAAQNHVQQEVNQDFEYNPESDMPWQQQLERFVESTVEKMSQKQVRAQEQLQEKQAQEEFRERFSNGMSRFNDFVEVVSTQPVTDPMTHAMRGINDPAAFIYAASKRHPEELQRISNLRDPVAQVVEMGKLEERMRRKASGTQAPKPISRTREDSTFKEKPKQEGDSIEKLIAQAEARKRSQLKQRRGG